MTATAIAQDGVYHESKVLEYNAVDVGPGTELGKALIKAARIMEELSHFSREFLDNSLNHNKLLLAQFDIQVAALRGFADSGKDFTPDHLKAVDEVLDKMAVFLVERGVSAHFKEFAKSESHSLEGEGLDSFHKR